MIYRYASQTNTNLYTSIKYSPHCIAMHCLCKRVDNLCVVSRSLRILPCPPGLGYDTMAHHQECLSLIPDHFRAGRGAVIINTRISVDINIVMLDTVITLVIRIYCSVWSKYFSLSSELITQWEICITESQSRYLQHRHTS